MSNCHNYVINHLSKHRLHKNQRQRINVWRETKDLFSEKYMGHKLVLIILFLFLFFFNQLIIYCKAWKLFEINQILSNKRGKKKKKGVRGKWKEELILILIIIIKNVVNAALATSLDIISFYKPVVTQSRPFPQSNIYQHLLLLNPAIHKYSIRSPQLILLFIGPYLTLPYLTLTNFTCFHI